MDAVLVESNFMERLGSCKKVVHLRYGFKEYAGKYTFCRKRK